MRQHQPLITTHQLSEQGRHAGAAYTLHSRESSGFTIKGQVQTHLAQAGATLHLVDVQDMASQEVELVLKPGLRAAWVLAGQADVSYGPLRFRMAPSRGNWHAQIVALEEPERFVRRARSGGQERAISLCLTPQWLLEMEEMIPKPVERRALQHLQNRNLPTNAALQPLLLNLLREPVMQPSLHALQLDGALQLLASHVLHQLSQEDVSTSRSSRPVVSAWRRRQIQSVRELLDSGEADDWSLEQIAVHCAMSAATLQRQFQSAFGFSLFGYQRHRRLHLAWRALARNEVDIATAASIAGYKHPANFSTAFSQLFGVSPRQVQRGDAAR
ncbi:helix-turn-helix transcriptional regulator [Lampropedia puyangensis]|uniref:Helix-turn-helix transcriptional regulator n=1 Tax=Lampropedia puyangensis TaxID=1330072 RepID=A0A4S8FEK6_9BURK|nr:AraC family transcriptional regulator [Lampropedia puyangensis]THU05104.1 helix-turn-helix transcriptional regulator [Lampropedia puyangensis]